MNAEKSELTLMFREINQEPDVILKTFRRVRSVIDSASRIIEKSKLVFIVGSGTSYHAGIILQIGLLKLGIPAVAVRAPEFSHYLTENAEGVCAILISQSGESREVLQALDLCKIRGLKVIGITNNSDSSLVKKSDLGLITQAGPEMSLAATKSHVAQIVVDYLVVSSLMGGKNKSSQEDVIENLSKSVTQILNNREYLKQVSSKLSGRLIFLGNGVLHATAMEGALKFEETANLITEAFPMGEYFHGPIQVLKDDDTVIILKGDEKQEYERIYSRVKEYTENIITVGSDKSCDIIVPTTTNEILHSVTYVIPIQLMANFRTVQRGLSPDIPSRLNKVVR